MRRMAYWRRVVGRGLLAAGLAGASGCLNFVNPVPATFPLISGVEYTLGVDLRNGDANGTTATDIAKVDYFRVDGATQTYIFTATAAPWSYKFVAPEAPSGGSTLTLRAIATDLSLNESAPAAIT